MGEDGAHQGSAPVAASLADFAEKLVARRGVEQSNVLFGGQIGPATKALTAGTTAISVGDKAPDFSLPTTQGGTWSLGEHLAQQKYSSLVLVFYRGTWCGYRFRRGLLAHAPRTLAVLDEAARRADWGRAPAGLHQGIAVVEFDDSVCAQVVELSVSSDGDVKVRRVVCVVDTGYVVHPDTVVAQMEGCIVQGLGAALTGEITITDGRVDQSNFHDYALPRIHETPRIETHLMPSGERYGRRWGGVGETGLPPLAPALVNAVFAATGKRVRRLPLASVDLTKI